MPALSCVKKTVPLNSKNTITKIMNDIIKNIINNGINTIINNIIIHINSNTIKNTLHTGLRPTRFARPCDTVHTAKN